MLTKGAIGNLINRYKAVLAKCNLINTFGSLAVASMLVLGGAGVADAADTLTDNLGDANTSLGSLKYNMAGFDITAKNINGEIDLSGTKDSDITVGKSTGIGLVAYGTIKDINSLTITASGNAIEMADDWDNSKNLEISNLTKVKIVGDGNAIQSYKGNITIKAETIDIDVAKRLIRLRDMGTVKLEADTLILKAGEELKASEDGGDSSIDIIAHKKAEIDAGLTAVGNVSVNVDIAGESSYIKGSFTGEGVDVTLSDGATWYVDETITDDNKVNQGASTFGKLTSKGGIVDMSNAKKDIEVTDLAGKDVEVLMDATATNTFSVENKSDTAVTATATQNADNVTKEQAEEMFNRLVGVENKTAEVADGIGKDGYTVTTNEKGEAVVSGGGASDVTKAALQQASVTTVALDKILTNDVRKRLGDIRSDKNQTGVWMRWDGGKMKGDSGLTNNFNTIQIGGDTKAAKNCRIGFAGSFTHGDTDFNRGNGELEGFSFALYGTWMGENGMFADVVARLGKFSTEMNVEGKEGDMDNRVASLSAEYGWRLPVCDQFFVEPQVELAYTYVSSDDLQLGDVKFAFDNVDSLTGRVGAVFGWNLPEERGNVYARTSVVQQFMGDAKVTGYTNTDPVVHETDGEDTWLEYGIGANVKLTDNTYVWADVERTEGADIEEEWRGTVGVRFSF